MGGRSGSSEQLLCGWQEARHDRRPGDWIGRRVVVEIKLNARSVRFVQLSALHTLWLPCSGPLDLEVKALRIGLRAVCLPSAVQGYNFVAQYVISRCEVFGDLHCPAVVVGDEDIVGPPSIVQRVVNEPSSTDLEELKSGLIYRLTIAGAFGEVIDDWAFMRLRPSIPLEHDLFTGIHSCVAGSRSCALVANDVWAAEAGGLDKPIIRYVDSPSDDLFVVGIVGKCG